MLFLLDDDQCPPLHRVGAMRHVRLILAWRYHRYMAMDWFVARPEVLDLLRSADALPAAMGEAVALCPVYGPGAIDPGVGAS